MIPLWVSVTTCDAVADNPRIARKPWTVADERASMTGVDMNLSICARKVVWHKAVLRALDAFHKRQFKSNTLTLTATTFSLGWTESRSI